MRTRPGASIIIPAYRSQATIARCLTTMFNQDGGDYEVVVVDSSPDEESEELVRSQFPRARFHHSHQRLLPYAARNRGIELATSDVLVFTDPDIYAPPSWQSRLRSALERLGGAVTGGLACHGRRWLEMGMHLCKFDPWLPGGPERRIDICPTANMACARATLEAAGGFVEEAMLADTLFSWRLAQLGIPIWFVPQALVHHHHMGAWTGLLQERFERGGEFAAYRSSHCSWSRGRTAAHLLVTLLPLRLLSLLSRGAGNALQARMAREYLRTSPVVITGQAGWLAGEAAGYLRRLRSAPAAD
jgi:glycosyltransferase involved in cell wall biosynthesis